MERKRDRIEEEISKKIVLIFLITCLIIIFFLPFPIIMPPSHTPFHPLRFWHPRTLSAITQDPKNVVTFYLLWFFSRFIFNIFPSHFPISVSFRFVFFISIPIFQFMYIHASIYGNISLGVWICVSPICTAVDPPHHEYVSYTDCGRKCWAKGNFPIIGGILCVHSASSVLCCWWSVWGNHGIGLGRRRTEGSSLPVFWFITSTAQKQFPQYSQQ